MDEAPANVGGAGRVRGGLSLPVDTFVTALLFLSGAAALIDEHLLSKLLVRVVGSSAEAVACVVVAFMGGMGLGAAWTGRYLARSAPDARSSAVGAWSKRPFLRYAAVEIAIAASILILPTILTGLVHAYASVARGISTVAILLIVRFVIAVIVVAMPAVLMGATLPLVLDATARLREARSGGRPRAGLPLARFYAANTLGAAFGVLVSTYLLVPAIGIRGSLAVAAACNVAAAGAALVLDRVAAMSHSMTSSPRSERAHDHAEIADDDEQVLFPLERATLIAFGSGLLAFAYEVISFRLLALVVGNSVYAFGLMLFVFLLGNGVGSRLVATIATPRAIYVAITQALVGAAALLTMPLWDDIPPLFQRVGAYAPSFLLWESTRVSAALVEIGPPTLAMGAAFGVLLRAAGGDGTSAAPRVARIYVANMIGAILGTLGATFILAPSLGSQLSLAVIAFGSLGLAIVALLPTIGTLKRRAVWAAALATVNLVLFASGSPWNVASLMSGSNVYFSEGFQKYDRLLRLGEDRAGGIVAVVQTGTIKTLLANGKFEGNDGFEVPDQEMFALFPLLFVKQHRAAVNIGVGTANTLAVMGAFPFEHLDAVDISAEIIGAARTEFAKLNGGILDNPRTGVHIDDGRNFLLRSPIRYDLIAVQLSSIWIGGSAELYNREFYDVAGSSLTDDGILQQWVQLHHIRTIDVARILATIRSRFPHVALWLAGHQGVITASKSPLRIDANALRRWPEMPKVAATLRSSGLGHPFAALGHFYMDEHGLDAFIAEVAAREHVRRSDDLVSHDDSATLEYSTPHGNLLADAVGDNMEILRRHAEPDVARFVDHLEDDGERRLLLAYAARERGFMRIAYHELAPVLDRYRTGPHADLVKQLEENRKKGAFWP